MLTQFRRSKVYSRLSRHEIVRQFIKYAIVGCLNVATFFAVFNGLLLAELPDLGAYAIAFFTTSVMSFVLNKRWSFRDYRTDAVVRQYLLFVFFTLVGLGLGSGAFRLLLIPLRSYGTLGKNAAAFGTLPISVLWNFNAYRRWTFKHSPRATSV